MTTAIPVIPSGSTQGKAIKIAATATPGTLLHTTGTSATDIDEIWVSIFNTDTVARKVTIEMGGTTSPDDTIEITIPPEDGPMMVIGGQRLSGNGSAGLSVRAFCATANVCCALVNVNRITP